MAKTEAELKRDRLRTALRENLKRRKAQARARSDPSPERPAPSDRPEPDER